MCNICAAAEIPQIMNGHGFLIKDSIRDDTKLQEGPTLI